MVKYPYRRLDGYRSILEAIDRNNAREWLKSCFGRGVRFCEVDMGYTPVTNILFAKDRNEQIDRLLSEHRNFVT